MSLELLHFIGCYYVDRSRIPVNSTLGVIKCSDFYEIQSTQGSTSFQCVRNVEEYDKGQPVTDSKPRQA